MSLDQIQEWLLLYPYLGAALLFLLCGLGLPLPEEIVLLAAGYACAKLPDTTLGLMMAWCAGAILVGDLIPFVLGRTFGTRLLRVRGMRMLVSKRRLATFDRWFRRRGDMVILIARFIAGLRVVAFFTAGAMKMPWRRFLLLDGLGIALIVPLLTWLGYSSQGLIDDLIENVQQVERGILWAALGAAAVLGLWYWLWRRRKRIQRRRRRSTAETFVQPSKPVQPSDAEDTADRSTDAEGGAPEPAPTTAVPAEPRATAATEPATPDADDAISGPAETPDGKPGDDSR